MAHLIQGLHHFQEQVFQSKKELFERLGQGQSPETLFITCSDSRIVPSLITHTDPGELFIIRNAGNIIPPHGAANGGEGAAVEYAVKALGVKHIVVCGHSHCGAMKGLLAPESLTELPTVANWLSHAEPTRCILHENYGNLADSEKLNVAIQENVLCQLENLRTLPSVASKLVQGGLTLHAWVYKIETGDVLAYEPVEGQFLPLSQQIEIEERRDLLSSAL